MFKCFKKINRIEKVHGLETHEFKKKNHEFKKDSRIPKMFMNSKNVYKFSKILDFLKNPTYMKMFKLEKSSQI